MDKLNSEEFQENSAKSETGYDKDDEMKTKAGLSFTYFQVFPHEPYPRHRHGCYWLPEPVSDSEMAGLQILIDHLVSVLRKSLGQKTLSSKLK